MLDLSASRRGPGARRQPIQAALLIGVLAGMSLGVAGVRAYDNRLHEAEAALQKAAALIEAASAGEVSPHTQRKFDQERGKALASIQDAVDHVVAAGTAADSDSGLP